MLSWGITSLEFKNHNPNVSEITSTITQIKEWIEIDVEKIAAIQKTKNANNAPYNRIYAVIIHP